MKPFTWNSEKNALLKLERDIAFEDVVFHILAGDIPDTLDHPNQDKYPGQKIHVVEIEGYLYLVPCVESDEDVFLKTIIPTKTFRGGRK